MRGRRIAAVVVGGIAAFGGVALMAAPVTASSPQRAGWWNLAPLGLVLSPAPTQSGRLDVGQETGSTSAVAALWYSVTSTDVPDPGSAAATLTVPYESSSSVGTPSVIACPIPSSSAGWKPGDNQPGSSAPSYDCSSGHTAAGQLASDNSSMTFKLTSAQLDAKNMAFDIALVPTGSAPFQAVFDVPGANGFVVQPPVTAPVGSSGAAPAAASGQSGNTQDTAGSGADAAGGGTAASPPPVGNPAPDLSGGGSFPAQASPSLPGGAAGPSSAGAAKGPGTPVAAGAGSSHPTAAKSGSSGWLGGRRQQLLGVWLMGDVVLVLFLFASDPERAPRLLGSMAARRRERPATALEETVEADADQEVRGIGRFSRPRSGPPRALT